jgi:TolA-binding protein
MDAETYFYIGQCLFLQKKFSEAANTLNLANVICEKHPENWKHIAHHAKDLFTRASARATH